MATHETWAMLLHERRSTKFLGASLVSAFTTLPIHFVGLYWVAAMLAVGSALFAITAGIARRVQAPKGYAPTVENVMIAFGALMLVVSVFLVLVAAGVLGVRRVIELGG